MKAHHSIFLVDRTKRPTNNLNMSMSQTMAGNTFNNLNSSFSSPSFGSQGGIGGGVGGGFATWGQSATTQGNLFSTFGGSGGALNTMSNVTSNGWLGKE